MSSVNSLGVSETQNPGLVPVDQDQPGAPGLVPVDQDQPGAPVLEPVVDASVEGASEPTQKFEWNVERLFVHDPNHSMARTWAVRVLSLLVGVPVLIFDIGRRIAFSLGIVDGKSFSLIDKTAEACQKVKAVFDSYTKPKELTFEEQNELSKQKIHSLSEDLVDGYKKLNGGFFRTNSSFSSPQALSAEKKIRDAKRNLIEEMTVYLTRNANSPDQFSSVLKTAKEILWDSIVDVAKDEFYIANKVERVGEPDLLRDIANTEVLDKMDKKALAAQFIDLAARSDNFAAGLMRGVNDGILSENQVKEAFEQRAQNVYVQALEETGLQAAEKTLTHFLDSGIKERIVERNETVAIDQKIRADVDVLASAAARDIVVSDTPKKNIKVQLIKVSKDLQNRKRLKPENVSQFLTSAQANIRKTRQTLEADRLRAQEEADRVEAERAEALQKADNQKSLFNQFAGMIKIIAEKQIELTQQFLKYDQNDEARRGIAAELETIRNAKVTIRGQEITVLEAAAEYYAAVSLISRSQLTASQRKQQMDALRGQGFSQTTIDRIKALEALEPRLTQLIDDQDRLANQIEAQHNEIVRLRAVYHVFRNHNFRGLELENRRSVVEQETILSRSQRLLNERHAQLIGKTGIIARLRIDEPSVPINVDPNANRQEVADLVAEYQKPKETPKETPKEPESAKPKIAPSAPRSACRKIWDGVTYPVRAPYHLYQYLRG